MKPSVFRSFVAAASLALLPLAGTATPVLNEGWAYDQIEGTQQADTWTASIGSDYILQLADAATFRITDSFAPDDRYQVWDFGSLLLTTTFYVGGVIPGPSFADANAAWANADYSHGEVILGAGTHHLRIYGDLVGGAPAGFYTRIDSVPDAGSLAAIAALLWAGLLGVRRLRRRG